MRIGRLHIGYFGTKESAFPLFGAAIKRKHGKWLELFYIWTKGDPNKKVVQQEHSPKDLGIRHILPMLAVLSFFCILDVRFPDALAGNLALGCDQFTTWENAQGVARYWFLHCPDEVLKQVTSHGVWLMMEQ